MPSSRTGQRCEVLSTHHGASYTKVKTEVARMVLVVHLWKMQLWFPVLLELLEDYPRVLPHQQDLVVMPSGQSFLMQQGVPTLITCSISGNPSHHKDFLQKLQTSCWHPGDPKPTPTMAPALLDGQIGVSRGIEIPLKDL